MPELTLDYHRRKVPIDHPDLSIIDDKVESISRNKISDLFTSPFWINIPDKPFTLIGKVYVTSNVDTVVFTGLDGNIDKAYLIIARIVAKVTGQRYIYIRPNGLAGTRTTIIGAYFDGVNAGTEVNGVNEMVLLNMEAGAVGVTILGFGILYAQTGQIRIYSGVFGGADGSTILGDRTRAKVISGYWNDTTTNITSLSFVSSLAGGIGAGSSIALYRLEV
jgi:hypothetical protein